MDAIAAFFKFTERGTDLATEARAGLTTFMVMAYIIFVNGSILTAGFGDKDPAFTAVALAAGTALVAGIMTIAMGVVGNYPFALAAGLGINAIVAFTLTGKGLSPAGAMGVIVLEGLAVTVFVVVGLREAIMNAVPIALKRAIGVGIGLFILFIGFANGGLIGGQESTYGSVPAVFFRFPTEPAQWVFLAGLLITAVLYVMKVKGSLVISILLTTVIALLVGVTKVPDGGLIATPSFDTLGKFDLGQVFSQLPLITALLTIFAIMLTDFFDTMGTVTGVAAEAGLAKEDGTVPGVGRVLLIDSLAAVAGGAAGRQLQHHVHRERCRRGRWRPHRVHLRGDWRPLPAGCLPLAYRRDRARRRHGTGPRAGGLPHVHPRQGHPRRGHRGGLPGAADHDPHAADV